MPNRHETLRAFLDSLSQRIEASKRSGDAFRVKPTQNRALDAGHAALKSLREPCGCGSREGD